MFTKAIYYFMDSEAANKLFHQICSQKKLDQAEQLWHYDGN
jgi:hypothetical protein